MKWFNCSAVFLLFCFSTTAYPSRVDDIDYFSSETNITEKQRVESLFRAAKTNDLETLKKILKSNKVSLNSTDKDVPTLLHIAAMEGSVDVISYLVAEQHVDVDYSIHESLTPLYQAVKVGQLKAVKLLIELGADKNILSHFYDNTLLHEAATGDNVEILEFLLQFYNIDHRNAFYQTPAYLAAREGKSEALNILLQNGADPDARDESGDNLMHAAVRSGQIDVVRELTRYKQLINAPNNYFILPIEIMSNMQVVEELVDAGSNITDYSIFNNVLLKKFDIVKYLVLESGEVNVRITWSTRDCRESLLMVLLYMDPLPFDMIKFILDQGADVNIENCENITALHIIAAYYGKDHTLEIIKLLLDNGADVNSPDVDGYTPLDYASRKGNHNVVEYLTTFGAITKETMESLFRAAKTNDLETLKTILKSNMVPLNRTDQEGRTLLHIAAMKGSVDVIEYLVTEQHVDIDNTRYKRLTPLCEAVKVGQLEATKLLVDLGADKNITFRIYGNTLLHEATTGDNAEVLKFLLPFYNIDEKNKRGQTPAYLAAREGKPEALHFLLENGADPYARDEFDNTLMHEAVRSGQVDVVRQLTRYKHLINDPNKHDELPVEIISNMQIVKELVDAGSIITDHCIYNYVNSKKFDVVKYLVVKSGKVNVDFTVGTRGCRESLLMTLLNMGTLPYDLIKIILDRGADVNIKYCMNVTALHRAAYYEKEHTLEIIKLLLDNGADVNAPDVDGYTPLDYARREGNQAVFKYLRTFGAVTRESMVSGTDSLDTTTKDDKPTTISAVTTTESTSNTKESILKFLYRLKMIIQNFRGD